LKRLIASMHDEINEIALSSAILDSPDEHVAEAEIPAANAGSNAERA
jgi:hypothetical protein